MAQSIEALNRVFSGRKSAIMVRSHVDVIEVEDGDELKELLENQSQKKFTVAYNSGTTTITTTLTTNGNITLLANEGLLCVSPKNGINGWIKINEKIGAIASTDTGYVFDFMIPNANSIDFTNEATVDTWNSFGDVYSQKMPTIMDWSASCGAKLDLGASKAQHFLYDCMLNQRVVAVYFYAGINFERDASGQIKPGAPIIDRNKTTVWYGNSYITNFSVTAAPDTTSDLSIDFSGNGELRALLEGEEVLTNWAELL